MRHTEIGGRLRRLIHEERLEEAEELLPEYARAVTEECISASREQEFRQARDFVRSTIQTLKARRAHYARQIADAGKQRAYFVQAPTIHKIDCEG